jgi:hypothetical protein
VVDLTDLKGKIFGPSTSLYDPASQKSYSYEFTLCGTFGDAAPVKSCPGSSKSSSICQEWADGAANIGSFSSASWDPASNSLKIMLGNGDNVGDSPRTAQILLTCDQSVDGATMTSLVNEQNTLFYKSEVKSKWGCPTSPGGGLFIFFIILVVILVIYIVGGVVYNKVKQIDEFHPHSETLIGIPGLIKDGALFIGSKTCCRGQ